MNIMARRLEGNTIKYAGGRGAYNLQGDVEGFDPWDFFL